MPKGLFALGERPFEVIYGEEFRQEISRHVEIVAPPLTAQQVKDDPSILHDVQVVFGGWGSPRFDETLLDAAPNLELVLYGAGSIHGTVSDAFWERGVRICSAWAANAVPVSEFTFAQIILALKRAWHFARCIQEQGQYPEERPVPGAYGSTVGIVSLGQIGQQVCERLKTLDVNVIAYDPFADPDLAATLDATLVSLDDLFRRADVVSLHTPNLPATRGMITGEHFGAMKPNASFINTARGAVVREDELIEVLRRRPDLYAMLDVTYPEPPEAGSPLYTLPNVVLTPHIAGSQGDECHRMGRYMIDELKRWLAGQSLRWEVTRERAATMA